MGDNTVVSVTATAPEDAEYLYDLIKAARIADGLPPVHFNCARDIRFRVPTGGATMFLLKQPQTGIEGLKIFPEESERQQAPVNVSSLLGWYVYGAAAGDLEVIQDY